MLGKDYFGREAEREGEKNSLFKKVIPRNAAGKL